MFSVVFFKINSEKANWGIFSAPINVNSRHVRQSRALDVLRWDSESNCDGQHRLLRIYSGRKKLAVRSVKASPEVYRLPSSLLQRSRPSWVQARLAGKRCKRRPI